MQNNLNIYSVLSSKHVQVHPNLLLNLFSGYTCSILQTLMQCTLNLNIIYIFLYLFAVHTQTFLPFPCRNILDITKIICGIKELSHNVEFLLVYVTKIYIYISKSKKVKMSLFSSIIQSILFTMLPNNILYVKVTKVCGTLPAQQLPKRSVA